MNVSLRTLVRRFFTKPAGHFRHSAGRRGTMIRSPVALRSQIDEIVLELRFGQIINCIAGVYVI
jgi:hypothetical protein